MAEKLNIRSKIGFTNINWVEHFVKMLKLYIILLCSHLYHFYDMCSELVVFSCTQLYGVCFVRHPLPGFEPGTLQTPI